MEYNAKSPSRVGEKNQGNCCPLKDSGEEALRVIMNVLGHGEEAANAAGRENPFSYGLGKELASVRRLMDRCEIKENHSKRDHRAGCEVEDQGEEEGR